MEQEKSVWHIYLEDLHYLRNIVGIMAGPAMVAVQQWSSGKVWATILVVTHSLSNLEKKKKRKQCEDQNLLILKDIYENFKESSEKEKKIHQRYILTSV